jgi:hypothetical protein
MKRISAFVAIPVFSLVLVSVSRSAPQSASTQAPVTPSVIGNGWGLDHVILAMPSADVVKDVFFSKLGFTTIPGNKFPTQGLQQAIIRLPPAYLEFQWMYQDASSSASHTPFFLKIVEAGGGPTAYNINVSPVAQAADAMKQMGMHVTLPPSVTVQTSDGKQAPGAWQFIGLDPADLSSLHGIPGGRGVGFLEYQNQTEHLSATYFQKVVQLAQTVSDPRRGGGEINANTARKLRSVWVAVPSVADAVKQAGRFGFTVLGQRDLKVLGEKATEVQCGQGTILFAQVTHPNSPLDAYVKKHQFGPIGVSVEVADIATAQRVVEQGMNRKFKLERVGNRRSFVVPADLAAGTFVEFVQQ